MKKLNFQRTAAALLLFLLGFIVSCKKNEEPADCIPMKWFQDADGDGLGNPVVFIFSCNQPAGYVSNASDTDDTSIPVDPTIPIPTTGYSTPASYPNLTAIWADEFDGSSLNEIYWNFQLGDGCPNLCGWGNNELEYYRKENTIVKDGFLIIVAKSENFDTKNYTSSRINTQNKFSMQYGRVDVRAALPKGQGIWPAIWMLGKNIGTTGWPACGEIDIMELVGGSGKDNVAHGTAHWDNFGSYANYSGNYTLASGIYNDAFHVFSIVWNAEKITWYVDDVQFHVIDITPAGLSEFKAEYFFLINLAVGGNWPGSPNSTTIFPQYLIVDYIRVFQ
jgi:beta-glucanase (GH16 family)